MSFDRISIKTHSRRCGIDEGRIDSPHLASTRMNLGREFALLERPERTSHQVLGLLLDINEAFVRYLLTSAREAAPARCALLSELREAIRKTNASAEALAARAPVLLLDMGFRDHAWWTQIAANPTRKFGRYKAALPHSQAVELARATLILAWYLARAEITSCLVLAGLSQPVARIVGALRPGQIDQIAEFQYESLRPRWEDRPSIWMQLLSGSARELKPRELVIRALQLSWNAASTAG